MKYIAHILLPNTTEYIHHEVHVNRSHIFPWVSAYLKACRIAKKAAKANHCYAYVSYEEAGCPTKTVREYNFGERYDQ